MLKKTKVDCSPPLTNARMIDKLVGEFLEETWYVLILPMHFPDLD